MIFRKSPAWGTLAVLILFGAQSFANACDKCKSCECKTAKCCDNKGLLDALDVFAGKLHSSLKSKKSSCDQAPSCGCEVKPSGGCEAKATCGCELTPSCGCEVAPECGCEVKGKPSPMTMPMLPLQDAIPMVPSVPAKPAVPAPLQTAPEVVPLPDTKVDPFQDDAASRIRKVPARTIQYRTDAKKYGDQFDPQASNRRPAQARARVLQVAGFDSKSSSRRPLGDQKLEPAASKLAPQVIPASAARPLSSAERTVSAAKRDKSEPVKQYHNPLR